MEADAYIFELAAGLLYLPVGFRLLWLAARTRQAPERALGLTFSLCGLSYVLFEIPTIFGLAGPAPAFYFAGRVALAGACYYIAEFTRCVFRSDAAWGRRLTLAVAALLALGLGISAARGDWGGTDLGDAGFWIEWLGQISPCFWVIVESVLHCRRARRRQTVGLADRATVARYLLWLVFGIGQLGATLATLPMYAAYEAEGHITPAMDALLGGFELLSLLAIWLVFFPPASFRRRLEQAPSAPALSSDL